MHPVGFYLCKLYKREMHGENSLANAEDAGFDPGLWGKILQRREWQHTPSILALGNPWTEEVGGLPSMRWQVKLTSATHTAT